MDNLVLGTTQVICSLLMYVVYRQNSPLCDLGATIFLTVTVKTVSLGTLKVSSDIRLQSMC